MKAKKIALLGFTILTLILYVGSWVPTNNPMVLYVLDSEGNTRPSGATGDHPPHPNATHCVEEHTNWLIMCDEGLNTQCRREFDECTTWIGLCPGCNGDVNGTVGIYGDIDGDWSGDCGGWVTAYGYLFTCGDYDGITEGGESPWYT